MAQRTIAEAQEVLDQMTLAPAKRREYERVLTRHVKQEEARLSVLQAERYEALTDAVSDIKDAYTEVEQRMKDLERDSRSRDMSADEYRRQFEDLQRQRDRLHHQAMSIQSRIDRYTEVEEDPQGYMDSLYERFPMVKPNFPW